MLDAIDSVEILPKETNVRADSFAALKPLAVQHESFDFFGKLKPATSTKHQRETIEDLKRTNIVMQNGKFSLKSPRKIN